MNALTPRGIEGELLGADATVRVIGASHPFRARDVDCHCPAGLSVAELLELALIDMPAKPWHGFVTWVDGVPVPPEWRAHVRVKPGRVMAFQAVPEKDAWRTIAAIAITIAAIVAAPYIVPLLPLGFLATGTATSLVAAGIAIGGQLALNALFPVRPPQLSSDAPERKQSFTLTGGSNQAAPWGAVPVVLGRHRMWPMVISRPFTEAGNSDQYLRMLVGWGYGAVDITDLKIGETAITTYEEVETQTRFGYDSDTALTLFPKEVFEQQLSIELTDDSAWQQRNTETQIDEISIDVTAPQGVYAINKSNGQLFNVSVEVLAEYKTVAAGSWTTFPGTPFTLTGSAQEVSRTFRRVKVARGDYQVRVRRSTGSLDAQFAGSEVFDQVFWTALRGTRNEDPDQFPDPIAKTAIRIRATDQLNGVLDNFNGVVTSRVKHWNGAAWVDDTPSRNPASLFRHVLQGKANKRPVPDARIDLAKLQDWADYCTAKGYTCDLVIDGRRRVPEVLADIAACGRAVPVRRDGKWSVSFDDTDDDPPIVQLFSPRNSWAFSSTRVFKAMPHGFRVRFINAANGWQEDERIVYADGYSAANATLFEGREFPGVTSTSLIWKFGRFQIAQEKLRPEVYTLTTHFAHLVCTRGDRVRVQHDVTLWGQVSCRVKSRANNIVTLDETVIMEAGKSYGLRHMGTDGVLRYHDVELEPGETNTVTLPIIAGVALPAPGEHASFGEVTGDLEETQVLRVLSIEPGDDLTATLTLVDDAPAINDADKGVIPDFDANVAEPPDPVNFVPSNVRGSEFLYFVGQAVRTGMHVFWDMYRIGEAIEFQIALRSGASPNWRTFAAVAAPQLSYTFQNLRPENYEVRVRAIFREVERGREVRRASAWSVPAAVALTTLLQVPPDVANFEHAILESRATLTWDEVEVLNLRHYEIRYSPQTTGVTWGKAAHLATVRTPPYHTPVRVGTYLIKAFTLQGKESANAALVVTTIASLAGFNAVTQTVVGTPWAGTHSGTVKVGDQLKLNSDDVMNDWASLSEIENLYEGNGGIVTQGTYIDGVIDLTERYVSRVTCQIDAFGETLSNTMDKWASLASLAALDDSDPADWDAFVEVRLDKDDGAGWGPWFRFISGDLDFRMIGIRLQLRGSVKASQVGGGPLQTAMISPVVNSATVTIDMPDRIEKAEDVAVPAGGLTVTFNPAFRVAPAVAITGQDLATGDRWAVTAKSRTGFTLQFFNSAGTPKAATADWIAKGHGRRLN